MKLTDKYDALLQRFTALEDENKALRLALEAVRASAARDLDLMVAEDASATDCARAIMITPAVWSAIRRLNP